MRDKPIKLKDLLKEAHSFATFKTDRLTSKMWILPNGEAKSLNHWHSEWLKQHKDLAMSFGLDLSNIPDNDTAIRISALNCGFVRINYEVNSGRMTIEANAKYFTKHIKDILFMLIDDNISSIDSITINLLNNDGKAVKSESNNLLNYDDREKMNNLPMLSEQNES